MLVSVKAWNSFSDAKLDYEVGALLHEYIINTDYIVIESKFVDGSEVLWRIEVSAGQCGHYLYVTNNTLCMVNSCTNVPTNVVVKEVIVKQEGGV